MANLSDADALAYSGEHVYYEIEQLFLIAQVLNETRAPAAPRERLMLNTLIQSFAIHVRNLTMLFYPDRIYPSDVLAVDFVADPNGWASILPPIPQALSDAKKRAHKEVAHLTTERITGTPPEKAWPVAALLAEIRQLLDTFVQHASSRRLTPKIANFLSATPRV